MITTTTTIMTMNIEHINLQDLDGLSPVHHATLGNRLAALVTLVQVRLKILELANINMFTPITLATITQLGAPTNLRSKAGRTPLAQARHDDHEELVSSTLDLGMI